MVGIYLPIVFNFELWKKIIFQLRNHAKYVYDCKDNLPGPDFIYGFLARHPELRVRKSNLIKRKDISKNLKIVLPNSIIRICKRVRIKFKSSRLEYRIPNV